MITLHALPKLRGKKRQGKRVGRGFGSGKGGHTVGRGQKGQKSRSKVAPLFEGGQLPLVKRLPHRRGFRSASVKPFPVNLGVFNNAKKGAKITPADLIGLGVIKKVPASGVKILGFGKLTQALKFSGFAVSAKAKKKIEAAGGSVEE